MLDTNVVIDAIRGRRDVVSRLEHVSPDDVCIASMTLAELNYGIVRSQNPGKSRAATERLIEQLSVIHFERDAALLHGEIRHAIRGQPVGGNDLVIACTALAARATLVTSDTSEFSRIPDLTIENWRE